MRVALQIIPLLVSLSTANCAHVRSKREVTSEASVHPRGESNQDLDTRLGGINHDRNPANMDRLETNHVVVDEEVIMATPAPRYGHCAAVVDGVMYMIGGAPLSGGLSGEVWMFSHGNASWKRVVPRGEGPQPIEGDWQQSLTPCIAMCVHCQNSTQSVHFFDPFLWSARSISVTTAKFSAASAKFMKF